MEIRIGIQNVAREVVLESDKDNAEISEIVAKALNDGGQLRLTDNKGRDVIVPVPGIATLRSVRTRCVAWASPSSAQSFSPAADRPAGGP
ncbi:DUF3107 domain-containing protein, partial [Arthrobacter sp. JCM 19049]|uniref:DUF3107 domain-containing protein n=1 Tax=Arthrobacter sp. JCM 19049 TaxID=1460643 RepID=UPI0024371718